MFPISDNGDFGFDPTFPFSFSHLPSLCDLLDADGCEAFPSQPDPSQNSGSAMNYFSRAEDGSGGGGGGGGKQRKRASKRDRHSKIVTARGLRDRRMRLSLEVARKFFGLQDLLGYEKASKTVEWLLLQANAEIKKLSRSLSMANPAAARTIAEFVGDCEVGNSSNKRSKPKPSSDKTGTNKLRKSAASRGLARDQRAKARERAKARTIAKKRSRECEGFKPNEATQQQLASWEAGKEALPSTSSMNNIQPDHDTFVSNPMIFSCPPNNGIPQEHQVLNGLSSFGKPWEAYNNHNNLVNNIYHGSRTIV